MIQNSDKFIILFAVAVLVTLTVGIVSAAPVTQNINYQGKLTDAAGNQLTGTYTVTFNLYEVSSGGTALATDIHTVQATKGLFTTQITADPSFFDGRALWLGIKVGADTEMTPRQEIRPVPYALSLRPGAWITSSGGSSALNLQNKGRGNALNALTTGQWSDGVVVSTAGQYSTGVRADTTNTSSDGVYASTAGQYSTGVRAYTAGPNSYGMIASTTNASSTGVYAHTSGQYSDGVHTDTRGPNSQGVYAYTAGNHSNGVYVSTTGPNSYGVFARTGGDSSDGVFAYTTGPISSGVRAYTTGPSSFGMIATTANTSSYGVYASTSGTGSPAIYGDSAQDVGVYGKGKEGGYFTTNNDGTSWQDLRAGVKMSTTYAFNPGLNAKTTGYSSNGMRALTTGNWSNGVDVTTSGANSYGVRAISDQNSAIYADTGRSDNSYGVETPDKMYAMSFDTTHIDVAEYFPVRGDPEPGTVLVIGADKTLQESSTAYDTRVAGIVSTDPGMSLGIRKEGNPGEAAVAVAGRVPCKVDTTHAPIHAGDLLTTSDTSGYAMKAEPVEISGILIYRPGTTIGKAMESLETGTGTIEVLVTLQ